MSRFCVAEGTKITLNDNTLKPIEEIIIGEELLVFDLNTLQKSQKKDILLKLKTNNFKGIFNNSQIKNIWRNTSDEYYFINNKLKITGEHIILSNRNDIYYWITVDKLQIDDYLFTENNIFEKINSIELIKENIDVYNLEVNTYYNYFANSYLIHNGAPCLACGTCGAQGVERNVWASILTRAIDMSYYANDYTGNWDVSETQFNHDDEARIYIVVKITADHDYWHDQCIAAVQHLNSNDEILHGWNFDNTTDLADWSTSSNVIGTSTPGLDDGATTVYPTPAAASGETFTSILFQSGGNGSGDWTFDSDTGTAGTGMQNGISLNVGTGGTALTVGNDTMAQTDNSLSKYYLLFEPTGSTVNRWDKCILRGPSNTFSPGDKIRVCQGLASTDSSSIDEDNSLFLGIY